MVATRAFARLGRRHAHLRAPNRRAVVGGDDLAAKNRRASRRIGAQRLRAQRPLPAARRAGALPGGRLAPPGAPPCAQTPSASHDVDDRSAAASEPVTHGTSLDSLMSTALVSPSFSENGLASSLRARQELRIAALARSRFCTAMIR